MPGDGRPAGERAARSGPVCEGGDQERLSALCLSGGGIRSAAFSLGVMQALATYKALAGFNYLSTVSGGGYVGSWLTNRIHRAERLKEALAELEKIGDLEAALADLEVVAKNDEARRQLLALASEDRLAAVLDGSDEAGAGASGDLLPMLGKRGAVNKLLAALAEAGRLEQFLASRNEEAVRLSNVLLRSEGPRILVQEELGRSRPPEHLLQGGAEAMEEAARRLRTDPLQAVRLGRRFLTPQPGFWSIGTWELVGTYLRNLAFNWMVLVPFFVAAVAAVKALRPLLLGICSRAGWRVEEFELEGIIILSLPIAVGAYVLAGALGQAYRVRTSRGGNRNRDSWVFRDSWAVGLRLAAMWLLLTSMAFKAGEVMHGLEVVGVTVASGLSMVVANYLGAGGGPGGELAARLLRVAVGWTLRIAAVVFLLAVAASMALLTDFLMLLLARPTDWLLLALDRLASLLGASTGVTVGWLVSLLETGLVPVLGYLVVVLGGLGFAWGASWLVDVNNYSLHKVYKQRLIDAFLGENERDDPRLCDLRASGTAAGSGPGLDPVMEEGESERRLFHVLNATLNSSDVSVDRRGLPFTFTAQMHGFWDEQLRPHFRRNKERRYLRLGWAMAISGAAANPSMGDFSSALVRFPMALLNLRLGWWLEHPCQGGGSQPGDSEPANDRAGEQAAPLAHPAAVWSIWKAEFLGTMSHGCACGGKVEPGSRRQTDLVNLSDGGHFDNLGLYEMVLRGCRDVIVVDASADPDGEYADLGKAVQRIRVDLGVDIRMNALEPGPTQASRTGPALQLYKGTIVYSEEAKENGTLVLVKPVLSGSEPADVLGYGAAHPAFPHESTLDQSFSEAQFESYRLLGESAIRRAVEFYGADKGGLPTPLVDSPREIIEPREIIKVLAESAYRQSRGADWPTHAGGILYEKKPDGAVEVVLARSTDNLCWVLPKGHIEAGESSEEAAAREIGEETGYPVEHGAGRGRLTPFRVEEFKRAGRRVRTAYFLMELRAADEVDEQLKQDKQRENLKARLVETGGKWKLQCAEKPKKKRLKGLVTADDASKLKCEEIPAGVVRLLLTVAEEVTREEAKETAERPGSGCQ